MNIPKEVLSDIIKFAKKNNVKRVVLFGSRARGDNTERSDIDIAAYGGDFDSFYWDIKEHVNSLLMFDIINLDEKISQDLRDEIEKTGIIIYDERMKKIDNISNSLNVLKELDLDLTYKYELYRTGVIGQFNLTFELAWKALQAVLRLHGADEAATGSPREIIQLGHKFNFINDPDVWLLMLKERNIASHVYDEDEINKLVLLIRDKFINAFEVLEKTLREKFEEVQS